MIRVAQIIDGKIHNVTLRNYESEIKSGEMLEEDALAEGYEWETRVVDADSLPDAEKHQVLDWLDDHGITSAHVEKALQSIPDETIRRKALLRWGSVNRIPANNPFVIYVAGQLGINHIEAWNQILSK